MASQPSVRNNVTKIENSRPTLQCPVYNHAHVLEKRRDGKSDTGFDILCERVMGLIKCGCC